MTRAQRLDAGLAVNGVLAMLLPARLAAAAVVAIAVVFVVDLVRHPGER